MSLDPKSAFQDELRYLRELGEEFAAENPKLTRYLTAKAKDPDIERLLEGFAFLTSRIRLKLDDEFPELSHGLIQLLWPSYLRPIPALTLMQFYTKDKAITEATTIPSNSQISSEPGDGTPIYFQTAGDVRILPLAITGLSTSRSRASGSLEIGLQGQDKIPFSQMKASRVRFHLTGDAPVAQLLYLWIFRFCDGVWFLPDGAAEGEAAIALSPDQIERGGFLDSDILLPYPSNVFVGYRLLQELLVFPDKFLCVDILGLDKMKLPDGCSGGTLKFAFTRPLPPQVRLRDKHIQLHCAPAANLFKHSADPLVLDGRGHEYNLRPQGKGGHFEIFSVEKVIGSSATRTGEQRERAFPAFESFAHEVERVAGRNVAYYRTRLRAKGEGQGLAHHISFISEDETYASDTDETITTDLLCTNGNLPSQLTVGDLCVTTVESPEVAQFTNLTEPTPTLPPPTDGALYWILISNLSLNYLSLLDADALRLIVSSYDFHALHDRQAEMVGRARAESIVSIETEPYDMFHKGLPIRGLRSVLILKESAFETEGEMYLFGTVLSEFFSMYASINSFHELEVRGQEKGEAYIWPIRSGRAPLI